MKEKWVQICQIQGYEDVKDQYWISNADEDKIMNKNTGKMKKNWIDDHGYKRVRLMTNQGKVKNCYLHVLKAKAFIYTPNPLGYNIVRHLNDVKTDNRLINLAWGTQSDNNLDCIRNGKYNYEASARGRAKGRARGHAVIAKKYSKPVRCIETGVIYSSTREAERCTGINNGNISSCCRGKCHTAGGFHWEFIEKQE